MDLQAQTRVTQRSIVLDRSVGHWMFDISKKNIKHRTISTLNGVKWKLARLNKRFKETIGVFYSTFEYYQAKFTNKRVGSLLSPLLACIIFGIPHTCWLKSIKVENHKKLWNRLLSISDTCQLISIEFDRQWSTFIVFRNYRHVTSCYLWAHSSLSVLT